MKISGAERGAFLRQIRKKAGKKIESFTSEQISKATISNIETNREPVSEEKVRLYCSLLNIDYNRLPEMIRQHQQEEARKDEEYLFYLESIEDMIRYSKPKAAYQKLSQASRKHDLLPKRHLLQQRIESIQQSQKLLSQSDRSRTTTRKNADGEFSLSLLQPAGPHRLLSKRL